MVLQLHHYVHVVPRNALPCARRTDGWEVKGDDRQRGVELCEAMDRFEFKGRSSGRATLTEVLRNESAQSQQKGRSGNDQSSHGESDFNDEGQATQIYHDPDLDPPTTEAFSDAARGDCAANSGVVQCGARSAVSRPEVPKFADTEQSSAPKPDSADAPSAAVKPVELQEQEVCSREPVSDHADDGQDTLAYNEDEAPSSPTCHSKVDAAEHKLDAAGCAYNLMSCNSEGGTEGGFLDEGQETQVYHDPEIDPPAAEAFSDAASGDCAGNSDDVQCGTRSAVSRPEVPKFADTEQPSAPIPGLADAPSAAVKPVELQEQEVCSLEPVSDHADDGQDTLAYNEDEAPSSPTCHSKVDAAEHKLDAAGCAYNLMSCNSEGGTEGGFLDEGQETQVYHDPEIDPPAAEALSEAARGDCAGNSDGVQCGTSSAVSRPEVPKFADTEQPSAPIPGLADAPSAAVKPVELQEQEVCSREPVSDHADAGQDTLAYNEDEAPSAPTCHSKVDAAEHKLGATGCAYNVMLCSSEGGTEGGFLDEGQATQVYHDPEIDPPTTEACCDAARGDCAANSDVVQCGTSSAVSRPEVPKFADTEQPSVPKPGPADAPLAAVEPAEPSDPKQAKQACLCCCLLDLFPHIEPEQDF